MKNLKRIVDLPHDFPLKLATLRSWFFYEKYPDLLFKIGGSILLDLDEFDRMAKPKGRTRKSASESLHQAGI